MCGMVQFMAENMLSQVECLFIVKDDHYHKYDMLKWCMQMLFFLSHLLGVSPFPQILWVNLLGSSKLPQEKACVFMFRVIYIIWIVVKLNYCTKLLKKVMMSQLVKKLSIFCGTWRFITIFTKYTLTWTILIQATPSYTIYLGSL
jgi:hypothetical protein